MERVTAAGRTERRSAVMMITSVGWVSDAHSKSVTVKLAPAG